MLFDSQGMQGLAGAVWLVGRAGGASGVGIGTGAFGFAGTAAPRLRLYLETRRVVVVINSLIGLMLVMVLMRNWRHLELRASMGLVLGGLAATPIGVLALNLASPGVLRITIAIVIIVLALVSLKNSQLPFTRSRMAGPSFGFLTTLATPTTPLGGPLAALSPIPPHARPACAHRRSPTWHSWARALRRRA